MTPTLKTARLTLAPPFMHEGMSVDHYLRWLCNETVTKYSEQRHREHTIDTQYEYLMGFKGDNHIWEIQRDTKPIGTVTAYRNEPNKTANIGILIGEPKVWGSGYGPEAWEAVTNYLFEDGVRKAEAGCMASNRPMLRILQKCGFTHEATLPNYFLLNGQPEDMTYHGKYREAKIIPLKKDPAA
jgi:RimJ/RimL family protein N-acetyltransferase